MQGSRFQDPRIGGQGLGFRVQGLRFREGLSYSFAVRRFRFGRPLTGVCSGVWRTSYDKSYHYQASFSFFVTLIADKSSVAEGAGFFCSRLARRCTAACYYCKLLLLPCYGCCNPSPSPTPTQTAANCCCYCDYCDCCELLRGRRQRRPRLPQLLLLRPVVLVRLLVPVRVL